MKSLIIIITFLVSYSSFSDEIRSSYPQQERVIAIGDTHADGDALEDILIQSNLIDKNWNWIGGKTYLVILGDLLDRGSNSRKTLDLLMHIEQEALKSKGRVITLLGNHEVMVLNNDLRYFSKKDAVNYADFSDKDSEDLKKRIANAFGKDSKYGRWISKLPAMVTIGDTLFTHGGIDFWIEFLTIDDINQTITSWVEFYLGLRERPDINTEWTIGDLGPLWTRKVATFKVLPSEYFRWLDSKNLKRLVVGHTFNENGTPITLTINYGDRFINLDTGNSIAYNGNLSSLEILNDTVLTSFIHERSIKYTPEEIKALLFKPEEAIGYVKPKSEFMYHLKYLLK